MTIHNMLSAILTAKNQNNVQNYFDTLDEAVDYVYSLSENEVLPISKL